MPEYLSPGVFIEEVPARLKAIEGVSTSTGGFVGAAERGTVPGYPLPDFTLPAGVTFEFPIDRGPVLTTSFAEFARSFGGPLALVAGETHGYLARAVRAFFANGGKRCFVTRVVHFDPADLGDSATRSVLRVHQGTVLRLARDVRATDTEVIFTSLRWVSMAGANGIAFFRRDGTAIGAAGLAVTAYDTQANRVTMSAAAGADLDRDEVFAVPQASTVTATGPQFFARTPGRWSERLSVTIANSEGPPVPITQPGAATDTTIQVQSATSFYVGALVEIDHGAANPAAGDRVRTYHEVTDIAGNTLTVTPALGSSAQSGLGPDGKEYIPFVRTVEIDVVIADPSGPTPTTEVYRRLPWNENPDPLIRRRHYSTVINTRSRLVYVLPPWADTGLSDSEVDITDQPTTANGFEARPAPADVGEDNYGQLEADDYEGVDNGPGRRSGIQSLQDVEDIRIVAAPGQTDPDVQNALIIAVRAHALPVRGARRRGASPTPTP